MKRPKTCATGGAQSSESLVSSTCVLIAAQSPARRAVHLRHAAAEGAKVQAIIGGALYSEPRAETLVNALAGVKSVHFGGHADAELYGRCTLAWVKNGDIELVRRRLPVAPFPSRLTVSVHFAG